MSTNFYDADHPSRWDDLDPQWHIGKTFYGGEDRGMGFIWAMEPGRLESITRIENEYGDVLTRQGFTDVLQSCKHQYFESIGVRFA